MERLPRDKAFEIWQNFFDNLKEEFFKVETLQHYLGENESIPGLEEFLDGDPKSGKEKLQEYAASKKPEEISIQSIRIRVIEEPLHPYLEFEIEHYKQVSIPLGREEVFLAKKEDVDDRIFTLGDFMVFDKNLVADSYYSEDGKLESMDIYESDDSIEKFLNARSHYLDISTPLSEFTILTN